MGSGKAIHTPLAAARDGLCTGCGTCEAMCPRNAITMEVLENRGVYVPHLHEERCTNCNMCNVVCPGSAFDFHYFNEMLFHRQPENPLFGNVEELYVGYARNDDRRFNSSSGGVVTQLLISLLEQDVIKGALVTKMDPDDPLRPYPFIATNVDEIKESAGSKYCPVPVNKCIRAIKQSEISDIAVVGLPCHIHGIRKAAQANAAIREGVKINIGLLCSQTPSFKAMEFLANALQIPARSVVRVAYRGEGFPGVMKLTLSDGTTRRIPYRDSGFGEFFAPIRCTLCYDHASELADISVGDAWIPDVMRRDSMGTSIIMLRNIQHKALLDLAVQNGQLFLEPVVAADVVSSQNGFIWKKKTLFARMRLMRICGQKIPHYSIEPAHSASPTEYASSILYYLLLAAMRYPRLWPFMTALMSIRKKRMSNFKLIK